MKDKDIIALLGGPTAVARILGIKTPSVLGWVTDGKGIHEGRLIALAATIEAKSDGRFSRIARWPDTYARIWPELAGPTELAAAVTSHEGQGV